MNDVLFLTQGSSDRLPSRRLRVIKILPFLCGMSFDLDVAPTNFFLSLLLLPKILKSRKVFIQKELVPISFLLFLKLLRKKIIFDFDDAIHLRQTSFGNFRTSRKRLRRFRNISKFSDLIIAGNEHLEKVAAHNGANQIVVIPTGVELPILSTNGRNSANDPITLGWIGTRVNLAFLECWEPIFERLEMEGVQFNLKIMSSHKPNFLNFNKYEFYQWSESEQIEFLEKIDIGLMPLKDNEYTAGKCAYKALQYMSHAKVVVASDVGINSSWLARAGFISNSHEEIFNAIKKLSLNSNLRDEMGATGRNIIESKFSANVIGGMIRDVILKA